MSGDNMGLGVHQGKNVAEMRAAVLTRRRCGFDTRPPHHGASGQRAGCQSLLERGKLSFRCVTKRKDAWRPGQTGTSWGARSGHGNTGIPHWPVQLRPPHQPRAGHTRVAPRKGAKHRAVRTARSAPATAKPTTRRRRGAGRRGMGCHHLLGA